MSESSEKCVICSTELDPNDNGIKCPEHHNMCSPCSCNFINTLFEDPSGFLPVKCSICKTEIPIISIEPLLNKKQKALILSALAQTFIGKDEIKKGCPFCSYFEVWPAENEINFLLCKDKHCGIMSCAICHKSIESVQDYKEGGKSTSKDIGKETHQHKKCMKLRELLKDFERVIQQGETMNCPSCGTGGRKDSHCTHMTCSVCNTVWCYICGLPEAKCNKDVSKDGMSSHNVNWSKNKYRCPMYFNKIHDIDDTWPSDDTECVSMFHVKRTLLLLQKFINKIGKSKYEKLMSRFPSVKSCGYSITEIFSANDTLFKRQ